MLCCDRCSTIKTYFLTQQARALNMYLPTHGMKTHIIVYMIQYLHALGVGKLDPPANSVSTGVVEHRLPVGAWDVGHVFPVSPTFMLTHECPTAVVSVVADTAAIPVFAIISVVPASSLPSSPPIITAIHNYLSRRSSHSSS